MHVRRILSILCFLVIAVWAGARVVSVRSDSDTLMRLEQQLYNSVARTDVNGLAGLLADDCLIVINGAGVLTERDLLSRIASSGRIFQLNEPHDIAIRLRGDTAIVSGILHQRYQRHGTEVENQLRYMNTWVRSGHSWVLLASHAATLLDVRP